MAETAAPSDPATLAEREARARVRMQALAEVTRVGVRLAQAVEPAVENLGKTADPMTPEAAEKLGRAYHLIARAVRLTVGLEEEIDQPAEVRTRLMLAKAAKLEAEAARAANMEAADALALRKRAVASAVRTVVAAETRRDRVRGLELTAALNHRLERDVEDRDRFMTLPFGELIARACQALGLEPDWSQWDEPWALEAQGADLTPLRERIAAAREAGQSARAGPDPSLVVPAKAHSP